MKTLFALAMLALPLPMLAQQDRPIRYFPTDPVNPCSVITPYVNNWVLGNTWQCVGAAGVNNGTWKLVSTSAATGPPSFVAANYVFTRAPGGTGLTGGVPAVYSGSIPSGVNGTDSGHYLLVSGPPGATEKVLITGGTGVAGGTGTLLFTPANSHGSTWTLSTATLGNQEAIQTAATAGAGQVIPNCGTLSASIVFPNGIPISFVGGGINVCTIRLAAGVNADVITNANFSTLTGSNTSGAGIFRVTLAGLTIDGNKAAQSGTSWGIRVYGHGYTFKDLVTQNTLSGGLYSEYAVNPTINTTALDLETFWTNIRVLLVGGDGILFRGPHDSYLDRIVSHDNSGRCFAAEATANYNGNVHLSHFDGYDCSLVGVVPQCEFVGVAVAGTAITCSAGPVAGSHGMVFRGGNSANVTAINAGVLGAGSIGLVVGGATGPDAYTASFFQGVASTYSTAAGSYAVQLGVSQSNVLDLSLICPPGGAGCINNVNDQGGTVIRAGMMYSNAPLLVGLTLPVSDTVMMYSIVAPSSGPQAFTQIPQVSAWHRYHLLKVANGTAGCANANGCWQINNLLNASATAGLTQTVILDNVLPNSFIAGARMSTSTAFTGAATVTANLGTSGNPTLFYSGNYDLKAAVSATNLLDIRPSVNANTNASQALVVALTSTGSNLDQIVTGSAVDIWIQWGILQ